MKGRERCPKDAFGLSSTIPRSIRAATLSAKPSAKLAPTSQPEGTTEVIPDDNFEENDDQEGEVTDKVTNFKRLSDSFSSPKS